MDNPKHLACTRFRERHSVGDIAETCGVTRGSVYKWHQIPQEHVLTLMREFNATLQELRPDLHDLFRATVSAKSKG